MPAKVEQLDALLLLEKRREQNRAAQKRFREKRAASKKAKQTQEGAQQDQHASTSTSTSPSISNLDYSSGSTSTSTSTRTSSTDVPLPTHASTAPWALSSLPTPPFLSDNGPWAPSKPSPHQHRSPSSSTSPSNIHYYHSDMDLSSGASSSGQSFSSPSTEVTPSPRSERESVAPYNTTAAATTTTTTTMTASAAQLDLLDVNVPPSALEAPSATFVDPSKSDSIFTPDIEVIQSNDDYETIKSLGLFGGNETWLRPMSPLDSTRQENPLEVLQSFMKKTIGFGDGSDNRGESSGLGGSRSDGAFFSTGKQEDEAVPLDIAWQIAQKMTKEQAAVALELLQGGQLTHAAMQNVFAPKPNADQTLLVNCSPFAKAMHTNLLTLGWLADDQTECHTNLMASIWSKRSGKFLRKGWDGQWMEDAASADQRLALTFPDVPTEVVQVEYMGTVPKRLSRDDQRRRLARLRNAPNMHPTKLQLEAPHSFFIDVLPWPSVRDQLIRLTTAGKVDMMDVKSDLTGRSANYMGSGFALRIHGDDPLDEEAWELSEDFLRKYHPLINFEPKIIRRTNFWRRLRGEPDLVLGQGGTVAMSQWPLAADAGGVIPVVYPERECRVWKEAEARKASAAYAPALPFALTPTLGFNGQRCDGLPRGDVDASSISPPPPQQQQQELQQQQVQQQEEMPPLFATPRSSGLDLETTLQELLASSSSNNNTLGVGMGMGTTM